MTAPQRSRYGGDTAIVMAGLLAAQGVMLAVMPVWARLFTPADLAALGLWTAVGSVVAMLLLMRWDTCIVIAASDAQARALVRLTLLLGLAGGGVLALLAGAALTVTPPAWLAAAGLAPLGPWLPLAVAAGGLSAAMAGGLGWANRQRDYRRISAARGLLALTAALLGTVAGVAGLPGGLLWAHAAAAVLALAALRWSLTPADSIGAAARAHADAPRYLWPAAMLDTVTQQIPLVLAAAWFGTEAAGQFSLAWRVAALPVLMVSAAAGSVFYQRFAALARQASDVGAGTSMASDRAALRALLIRHWRMAALLGAAPTLLLMLAGGPLFAWVFGAAWAEAGRAAAVLAPMLLAMAVSSPTSGALIVLGRQRWSPLFGLAMLMYRPAAFAIGAHLDSLLLALALWAACEVVAIVLYNRIIWRALAPQAGAARGPGESG